MQIDWVFSFCIVGELSILVELNDHAYHHSRMALRIAPEQVCSQQLIQCIRCVLDVQCKSVEFHQMPNLFALRMDIVDSVWSENEQ